MAGIDSESSMPQWKKDLISRRRAAANNKIISPNSEQLSSVRAAGLSSVSVGCAGHQPSPTSSTSSDSVEAASVGASAPVVLKCKKDPNTCSLNKMVRERTWADHKQIMVPETVTNGDKNDSDSSEELQYGPGIVSKLKNRYLSLTLREASQKSRPSILHMRKATSLENILDDDSPVENRKFESRISNGNAKNVPNRYRNSVRGSEMKRARSVETISRTEPLNITNERPKSIHEDVFIIKEGNDAYRKTTDNNQLFEPETKYTARINRPKRITPVMNEKEKPPAEIVKQAKRVFEARPESRTKPPQHTGEVAAIVANFKNIIIQTKVSKPTLKQKPPVEKRKPPPPTRLPLKPPPKTPPPNPIQSPIPDVSIIPQPETEKLSETPDLILHSSPIHKPTIQSPPLSDNEDNDTKKPTPEPQPLPKPNQILNPITNTNFNSKIPPNQPLKLDIQPVPEKKISLSPREIEKNFINVAKTQQQSVIIAVNDAEKSEVPKPKRPLRAKQEEQNCVVFKFTDRQDVPDYIGNDGTIRTTGKIERPKTGEGGIILLPGASIGESFTDFDEEFRSLEGPPSPCDVSFINANILIDGRSSLSQKTKKTKMRIQFVEAVPQIFEYPSEASMLLDDPVQSPQPIANSMGHAVPSLSGSSLANYTPKSACSTEEFQLGVTKCIPVPQEKLTEEIVDEPLVHEVEEPILFSSGTNSDILF